MHVRNFGVYCWQGSERAKSENTRAMPAPCLQDPLDYLDPYDIPMYIPKTQRKHTSLPRKENDQTAAVNDHYL